MGFTEDVREILGKLTKEFERKKKDVGISLLAGCLRAAYYKITSGVDSITDKMLYGTEHHHWFARTVPALFAEKGYRCITELKVSFNEIRGYADMYCEKDGKRYVVEVKFTSNPSRSNPFLQHYRKQAKYYASILNADALLLLLDYNISKYYLELIMLSEQERRMLLAEMEERYNALKSGKEPPPEPGKWCKFCFWRKQCLNTRLL